MYNVCDGHHKSATGPSIISRKVKVTLTNSIAENWMRNVKKNILKDESILRLLEFYKKKIRRNIWQNQSF